MLKDHIISAYEVRYCILLDLRMVYLSFGLSRKAALGHKWLFSGGLNCIYFFCYLICF